MTKKPFNTSLTREFQLRADGILDIKERTIEVSFSSEEPVLRRSFFSEPWLEVLGHDNDEINLARLNNGAPVLYNHDRQDAKNRIGVVVRAWVQDGRGKAVIRLSKREEVDPIWQDVEDGILRNVSVSYTIEDFTLAEERDNEPDIYRITSWTPLEISLVDIPADPSVGVGRTNPGLATAPEVEQSTNFNPLMNEEKTMTKRKEVTSDAKGATNTQVTPEVDVDKIRAEAIAEGRKQGLEEGQEKGGKEALEAENKRRDAIRETFKPFGDEYRALENKCVDDLSVTQEKARDLLLAEIGKGKQPLSHNSRIEVGEGEREKFSRAAENAIAVRAGLEKPDAERSELVGYTLFELARKSLEIAGVNTSRLDKREIVGRAFTHSTSDFTNLLSNNANKAMLRGYSEAPEVFDRITRPGNLSDFKIADRVGLSEFSNLDEVKEGGEYKYGTLSDRREQIQLAKYGKLFSITREAIINDDLNAFTEIPRKMGRAARRKVGDLVFNILNTNPNMADGVALFHSNHANLADSGGAPTVATVGAGRKAMRIQTDSSGNATLNIPTAFFIVPAALEDTAKVLMASETDPGQGNSRKPNAVRNAAEVVVEARLDAASATAWYLTADPNMFDTIEVGYLDGNPNPFLEQQDGWSVDGVDFKVRIDAAAKALDHRTMYKNAGV